MLWKILRIVGFILAIFVGFSYIGLLFNPRQDIDMVMGFMALMMVVFGICSLLAQFWKPAAKIVPWFYMVLGLIWVVVGYASGETVFQEVNAVAGWFVLILGLYGVVPEPVGFWKKK